MGSASEGSEVFKYYTYDPDGAKSREREFLSSIHWASVLVWRDSRSARWLDSPAM